MATERARCSLLNLDAQLLKDIRGHVLGGGHRMLIRSFILLIGLSAVARAFAAPAAWLEVRSRQFTIVTDASEHQAHQVLDQFERMRWVFQTLFPQANLDPSAPILVLASADRQRFRELEPRIYLGKGQMDLSGCFLRTPETNYVLLRLDVDQEHPFATVYHEYTHLEFGSMSEWIPLWLNEGLAEFFENTELGDREILLGRPSLDDIHLLRHSDLIPLAELFRVDVSSPYYHEEQKGSVFYAESWALTHFLEVSDRENRTNHLTEYIGLLRQHEDPVSAAEKAFGDLGQLASDLKAYIHANAYHQLTMSRPLSVDRADLVQTRVLSATEADILRANLLTHLGRTAEARKMLDAVLQQQPRNATAVETMGFLEFSAGNRQVARKLYAQALQLDPANHLPPYYIGLIDMEMDAPEWDSAAESSLRAALRLNPGFAPALNRLALFYALRRTRLEEAKALSFHAVELDPGNFNYRMDASSILMEMQRFREAETVMQAAVRLATRPEQWQAACNRLAQIQQIEAEMATRSLMAEIRADGHGGADIVVIDKGPRQRDSALDFPRHEAEGVISKVTCHSPFVIDFQVVGSRTSILVTNSNYLALHLTATGFTPKGEMDPCRDFEGRRARVEYAESPDKAVDGRVTAIELRN